MKKQLLLFILFLSISFAFAQDVTGKIVIAGTLNPLESVNIVNLNQVIGTSTDSKGEFTIKAQANDTLHLSYLGYKSLKVRVTNDWINFNSIAKIEMTELALALEEVVVTELRLTGYLEVDIKQVPIQNNIRYSISGLPSTGYESSPSTPSTVTKVLGAIFNPADFLHNLFGKKPREMRKLRKMKEDNEIRNLLASRFDREMLMVLLQVDKVDLDMLISECNYSKDFLRTANDLQILDAISECYEEYRVLNRSTKKRL
ncbi:MAG: carboxypeptidase-like regulatory domain-containing protein [Flavobacteriaceae bacterium]|nr:carboxypeptidase-like regulatory domain-containing protein [Flavobacteriaceae bacterium]